jgi:hypothetical protein
MVCDFEFVIQALHDLKWVSIAKLAIGTPCGGYPLTDAMWMLLKSRGVRGTYGMEFPVCDDGAYVVLWKDGEKDKKRGAHSSKGKRGKCKNAAVENAKREAQFVYYSADQMGRLVGYCGFTFNPRAMQQTREHAEALAPIPGWLSLARSSLPIAEELDEWSEPQDAHMIPDLLKRTRAIRTQKLARMLAIAMRYTPLGKAQIELIADYALPCATDVRLAWRDGEGEAAAMRAGANPPPSTGQAMPDLRSCAMH